MGKGIILVRHGESAKNLEYRHGGEGKPLTGRGHVEVKANIELLRKIGFASKPRLYYYSKGYQVIETVHIIASHMEADLIDDERLRPISLGALDNLSEIESKNKFPQVTYHLEQWKRGHLDIRKVNIPGSENLNEFWMRGSRFITDIKHKNNIHIVIADRSILILLINLLLNKSIDIAGDYRFTEIPTGGLLSFVFRKGQYYISESLSNYRINDAFFK